ncbi:hypothetical protein ACC848_42305, partial [Rhizobium johnstonii]
IANFIHKVFGILPGAPHPPAPLQWVEIGLYGLALFLWGCGCYRLTKTVSTMITSWRPSATGAKAGSSLPPGDFRATFQREAGAT